MKTEEASFPNSNSRNSRVDPEALGFLDVLELGYLGSPTIDFDVEGYQEQTAQNEKAASSSYSSTSNQVATAVPAISGVTVVGGCLRRTGARLTFNAVPGEGVPKAHPYVFVAASPRAGSRYLASTDRPAMLSNGSPSGRFGGQYAPTRSSIGAASAEAFDFPTFRATRTPLRFRCRR